MKFAFEIINDLCLTAVIIVFILAKFTNVFNRKRGNKICLKKFLIQ